MEPKSSPLESAPGGMPRPPEFQPREPERGEEYHEQPLPERAGESPRHEQATPPPSVGPIPIALPVPQPTTDDNAAAATTSDDDTPAKAGNEDLIEKEWVDKAKKIITETKDDPYRREREVGRLQADYLKKRYGKHLGTSD